MIPPSASPYTDAIEKASASKASTDPARSWVCEEPARLEAVVHVCGIMVWNAVGRDENVAM